MLVFSAGGEGGVDCKGSSLLPQLKLQKFSVFRAGIFGDGLALPGNCLGMCEAKAECRTAPQTPKTIIDPPT